MKTTSCSLRLFVVVMFVLSTSFISYGQEEVDSFEQGRPLLSDNVSYFAFIGPSTDVLKLKGHYFVCPGATAGVIVSHKYLIGVYTNFLLNHTHVETREFILYNVKYEYGGVWLGYLTSPIKNVNFSLSSKFGKADITIEKDNTKSANKDVLMATPQLDLFYEVNSWFKVVLSSGFRMTTDLKLQKIGKNYFNGPNTTVGFLFGGGNSKGATK